MKKIPQPNYPRTITLLFLALLQWPALAQSVTVETQGKRQQFQGAGTSIGLYLGHHYSMSDANEDKAIKLINQDIKMTFLQEYINEYPSNVVYYDNRANYFKAAKAYRPNSKISLCPDRYPDNLRTDFVVNGETKRILDVQRPGIYDEVADWYFQMLQGFKDRGVEVDIINIVNEPDYTRTYHYGYGNPKKGVAFILKEAVPRLKSLLNNPNVNTSNIKVPKIMAPSNLGTASCLEYIRYFKQNYPSAWNQVDIVSLHQYGDGLNTGTMWAIRGELDGREFIQSEMHADHSDNLNLGNSVERPHRTALDLSALFIAALNSGTHAWFYFENNYPQVFHPGGLMRVAWGGSPQPYKHYYTFKQLTSSQPINSTVLSCQREGLNNRQVLAMRKGNSDDLYLHLSNFNSYSRNVTIRVNKNGTEFFGISQVQSTVSDATRDAVNTGTQNFNASVGSYVYSMPPYSINTLRIKLDDNFSEGVNIQGGALISLKSVRSGKMVDVRGNDNNNLDPIVSWPANGGNKQKWVLVSTGNGYYQLKNFQNNKCMDVQGSSKLNNGDRMVQWDCHGGWNQQWRPLQISGNRYQFQNRRSGKCLDLARGNTDNLAPYHQWTCSSSNQNQQFDLTQSSSRVSANNNELATFQKDLLIYPNPSTDGRFNISQIVKEYQVFTSTGSLILVSSGHQIDLSRFHKGMYFLKTDESQKLQKLVIK